MYESFKKFVQEKIADFRRIAWNTKGEIAVEELTHDALIIALELGEKRGLPIDFSQSSEREIVMSILYNKSVKRREKHVQYAVRIDEERPGEDGTGSSLADRLPARKGSDPLIFLLSAEAAEEAHRMDELKLASSYSEATAYSIAIRRLGSREKLCMFLSISNEVILQRLRKTKKTVLEQASLFDRIERISKTFMPLPGKFLLETERDERSTQQLSLTLF